MYQKEKTQSRMLVPLRHFTEKSFLITSIINKKIVENFYFKLMRKLGLSTLRYERTFSMLIDV